MCEHNNIPSKNWPLDALLMRMAATVVPGFCVKFRDVDWHGRRLKAFVNVCHSMMIAPADETVDEVGIEEFLH